MSKLVAEYENKIADLRVALTQVNEKLENVMKEKEDSCEKDGSLK